MARGFRCLGTGHAGPGGAEVTLTLPVAELGHFALILALLIAIVQSILPMVGASRPLTHILPTPLPRSRR